MKTVAVIDYGMSNLRSVSKSLEFVAGNDWQVLVTNELQTILQADKVVFPGQGAIGNCITLLNQTGLSDVIQQVLAQKPFLGLCLGLQTLLTMSEESGGTQGFNWAEGKVKRFNSPLYDQDGQTQLKIPHMGWNQVQQATAHELWKNIPDNSRFYFVHSYYVAPKDTQIIAGTTNYSIPFTSAIAKDNVFAVQFHPEKSQQAGLTLMKNFLHW